MSAKVETNVLVEGHIPPLGVSREILDERTAAARQTVEGFTYLPEAIKAMRVSVVTVGRYLDIAPPADQIVGKYSPLPIGRGTGFFISENRLVTNRHVVEGKGLIFKITTADGTLIDVRVVYASPISSDDNEALSLENDFAILEIIPDPENPYVGKPVTLGDSDALEVGQSIYIMGQPGGQAQGWTAPGIVSSVPSRREGTGQDLRNVISTNADFHSGVSGGPMVNAETNEVVGINTFTTSPGKTNGNIGHSVAINEIKPIIKHIDAFVATQAVLTRVLETRDPQDMKLSEAVRLVLKECTEAFGDDEEAIQAVMGNINTKYLFLKLIKDARGSKEDYVRQYENRFKVSFDDSGKSGDVEVEEQKD